MKEKNMDLRKDREESMVYSIKEYYLSLMNY